MTADTIQEKLTALFQTPLREFYDRRIVFWRDPDRAFADLVDTLDLPGVRVLKLTGSNAFTVKQCLNREDTEHDCLIYDPLPQGKPQDDWLLDIRLYSEEFRADLVSLRMDELRLPHAPDIRQCVQQQSRFFENKTRVARLLSFGTVHETAETLQRDMLAVLTQAGENTASGILRGLLLGGLSTEENTALQAVRKFGDEAQLWALITRTTGYGAKAPAESAEAAKSLLPLAAHVLLTALSMHVTPDVMGPLEGRVSRPHQRFCYEAVDEWMRSEDDDALYDIARQVEEALDLPKFFADVPMEQLLEATGFPCIQESILRRFFARINDQVIQPDEILTAVEKRRGTKWYKRVRDYYEGILQVARMQQFYQAHAAGLAYARYTALWEAYRDDLYQMDTCYRRFRLAFSRSLRHSNTVLEDLYKGTAEYVENLYGTWFLPMLNSKWSQLTDETLAEHGMLPDLPPQHRFFRQVVAPAMERGRVFVVISDALRYEIAVELAERLNRQSRGVAKMQVLQGLFPTVTSVGMAALLPHRELTLSEPGMTICCDGRDTAGTGKRQAILRTADPEAVAMPYTQLLTMKRDERRDAVSRARVVYLYHNRIDAEGDKALTEHQVFSACEETIDELRNLVHIIANELNGSQIFITADHGFLYTDRPLSEAEKHSLPEDTGEVAVRQHRYALVRPEQLTAVSSPLLTVPLPHLHSDLLGLTPRSCIRLKTAGGGANYVHGGLSLEEMMVPVIEFRNLRTTSRDYVETRRAEVCLLSQIRKVSNNLFNLEFYQKEPVADKVVPATYQIALYDAQGQAVSETREVLADRTGAREQDRVFRLPFALKNMPFSRTDPYYLIIQDKESGAQIEQIEFRVDIAFAAVFDF